MIRLDCLLSSSSSFFGCYFCFCFYSAGDPPYCGHAHDHRILPVLCAGRAWGWNGVEHRGILCESGGKKCSQENTAIDDYHKQNELNGKNIRKGYITLDKYWMNCILTWAKVKNLCLCL